MTEKCYKCGRSEKEVKLVDVIYGNEIVKMCEECVVVESLPVLRRPTIFQLRESREQYSVKDILKKMSGVEQEEEKAKKAVEDLMQKKKNL